MLADQFLDGVAAIESFGPKILVIPDILANGDADFPALKFEGQHGAGWFKVAVFIEDIVGGQKAFKGAPNYLAILKDGGGIAQVAAGQHPIVVHVAHAERHDASGAGDGVEGGKIGGDEIWALQEVAGRVAAKEQFRGDNELCACGDGLMVSADQFGLIGGKIADG